MPQQQHNSAAGRPILQLRNVSKHFGAVSALTDIELEVHAGEDLHQRGFARAVVADQRDHLAGVHQPTSGTIEFDGNPVTLDSPGKALEYGIATVFQDLALCENLDVVANLFLGHEISPFQLDEVAMEVKAWTLLQELAARIPSVREPVASLSGGQRQTVAIARSLLLNPKIIMLDEPTAALGVAQTAEVLNLIERVRERGLGVIIISHNMEDVRAVADRIVVLRLGRNKGIFTPDASNQDLVAAITGATENAVSRRVERKSQPTTSGAM
ncbi:sugar ABC transporter ATP-binding protein [Klebsiella aerogenes]|nr:sugar ABC transporter ATP-binding protein [Klebsiella aerogenes]